MSQQHALPTNTLRDALRLHASVLETFEVHWLGLPEVLPDGQGRIGGDAQEVLIDFLLTDANRVDEAEQLGSWTVPDHVRRTAAAMGFDALRSAWEQVDRASRDSRPMTSMQLALDDVFRTGFFYFDHNDPEQLQSAAQIAGWFEPAGDPIPTYDEIEAVVSLEAMLEPLRRVVGDYFRDRVEEMDRLRAMAPGDTLYVKGGGGIGKSALVGKFVLEALGGGAAISYLNFDHSALDPTEPATLVGAMARQLSWQLKAAERLSYVQAEAADVARFGDSVSKTATRGISVAGDRWVSLVGDLLRQLRGQPLIVVFDTMEQAQRKDWELRRLRELIHELQDHDCYVIGSGRGAVSGYEELPLFGLPMSDAIQLLSDLLGDQNAPGQAVELDRDRLAEVAELTSGSPLCLRLAAAIIRTTDDPDGWFAGLDLSTGVIEGELYRRLLSHIEDDDLKALAYPGLALRIVTPDLVRDVLSEACGVSVAGDGRVDELFEALASEGMLVERLSKNRIMHRSDIRPLMMKQLTHDHKQEVTLIHRLAINYYSDKGAADPAAATEKLYHQMMLGEDLDDLVGVDIELLRELSLSSEEFPTETLAWLVDQKLEIDVHISDEELKNIDLTRRRPVVQAEVERRLTSGDFAGVTELLESQRGEDGRSILPSIEIQVLEVTGQLVQAAELAAGEQQRAMAARDLVATIDFALQRARIWERLGDTQAGADHLVELRQAVLTSESPAVTDMMRLRVITVLMRLVRLGASVPGDDLDAEAVELFDRIDRSELFVESALLRDLVAELGADAPTRVMTLALDAGVISDEDGELADVLAELDGQASAERGRDHGVVAEMAQVALDANGVADWKNWIGGETSSTAATQVGEIIEYFDEGSSANLRGAVASKYRKASDEAYNVSF